MCNIDYGDATELFHETKHKARKPHRCSSCRGPILAGQRYVRNFMINEGEISSEKMCEPCEIDRKEFTDAHDSGLCNPGFLRELLEECVSEGDEESDLKWQPMPDRLRARGQQVAV